MIFHVKANDLSRGQVRPLRARRGMMSLGLLHKTEIYSTKA